MKTLAKLFFWAILPFLTRAVFAQISIPDSHYKVETHSQPIIIVNQFPTSLDGEVSTIQLGGDVYTFAEPITQIQRNLAYAVSRSGINYQLFFSAIAIVDIQVEDGFNAINNDVEIKAEMTVMDTIGPNYSSTMAIRHRGASSLTYPKKSYRVQLKDENFKNKHESIFGLRSDRRWLMLALYNERLRINNKVCHDLWLDMHKLYYHDLEPDAHSTIRSRYVLAFIDNQYRGMYLFTEDVDAKQYKLFEDEDNEEDVGNSVVYGPYQGGELYKGDNNGAPNHFEPPLDAIDPLPSPGTEVWEGWELKFPDVSDWVRLRDFSLYVKNTPTADLQATIWNQLHKENFIDYYLFINLVLAEDNLGKNLFMAKYRQGEPYFYGVWDLDGTLGYEYNSSRHTRDIGLIGNHLWGKLLENNDELKDEIAVRWFTLRKGLLATNSILARVQKQYDYLEGNGAYRLESIAQGRTPQQVEHGGWDRSWFNPTQDELNYMRNFISARLAKMDTRIEPWLSSPLPVQLASFDVHKEKDAVQLQWATTREAQADRFEIEHSNDAAQWKKIGIVTASGDSETVNYYRFVHSPVLLGVQYYRLRMIDKDGSDELSLVRSIDFESEKKLILYPNPVSDVLSIDIKKGQKAERLTLMDGLGREVWQQSDAGLLSNCQIPVAGLNGLYWLKVFFADGTQTLERVLVVK